MFSVGDGKRKFIYSYKALESLKTKSYKNIQKNYLVLNQYNSKSGKKFFFSKYQNDICKNEKPSKFFLEKNKEINKINTKLLNKKVDIFLNKAFDISNSIRNYYSHKNLNKRKLTNLIEQKFPKINCKSQYRNKNNNFFKNKIKDIIMTNYEQLFPEKYINSRERTITTVERKISLFEKKLIDYENNKKLFKIKYLKNDVEKENNKTTNQNKKDKLINKFVTIYNAKNKKKLLIDITKDKTKTKKSIDVGLNTIPYS